MALPPELDSALVSIQRQLAESLIAVYLHGSAATGGLRPHSDIDLLVVVDRPVTLDVKKRLAADLMMISGRYPFDVNGRRPLEVIIFLRDDLAASLYPARCEFIYGEWLRNDYETGKTPESVCDPELTLILAQARKEAIPLFGPNANTLLPVISKADIHRAIKDALPALIETLRGDERNVLLTLARMWRTLVTGEFVSKDAAAAWAAARLPTEQARVLTDAKAFYLTAAKEDWSNRRQECQLTVNSLRHHVLSNL